jgi:hypothetical protein
MAYQPVHDSTIEAIQPAHSSNIELDTHYDPGSHRYAPPSGRSPSHNTDGDSKQDDIDVKNPFFRRSTSWTTRPPGSNRPLQAQQVATVTPLRAGLMIFDAILASTPIMFVGEFVQLDFATNNCAKFCEPLH